MKLFWRLSRRWKDCERAAERSAV